MENLEADESEKSLDGRSEQWEASSHSRTIVFVCRLRPRRRNPTLCLKSSHLAPCYQPTAKNTEFQPRRAFSKEGITFLPQHDALWASNHFNVDESLLVSLINTSSFDEYIVFAS